MGILTANKTSVLIRFAHGLGDAVQFTAVLRHIQKHRPEWEVDVTSLRGKHSAFHGLCRRSYHDQEPERPPGPYGAHYDLGFGSGPSKEPQALFRKLNADIDESSFTNKEVEHRYDLAQQQAGRLLKQLLDAGLLEKIPGSGQRPAQWSFTGKMLDDCSPLPPSEDLFPVCTPATRPVTAVNPYQLTTLV